MTGSAGPWELVQARGAVAQLCVLCDGEVIVDLRETHLGLPASLWRRHVPIRAQGAAAVALRRPVTSAT